MYRKKVGFIDIGYLLRSPDFPSDVEVALYLLEREFPQKLKKKGVAPVLLESQLYSLIDNNNDVDREMVPSSSFLSSCFLTSSQCFA